MKTIKFEISIEEANLILEALGQLPFVRVFSLIGKLQEQARAQTEQPLATSENGVATGSTSAESV